MDMIKTSAYMDGYSASRRSVLVVDDEVLILRLVKRILKDDKRIHVQMALDSAHAFGMLESNPELVLMDIELGGCEPSGLELVSRIRSKRIRWYCLHAYQ
jgi:CheY-like chemotaxis protein